LVPVLVPVPPVLAPAPAYGSRLSEGKASGGEGRNRASIVLFWAILAQLNLESVRSGAHRPVSA